MAHVVQLTALACAVALVVLWLASAGWAYANARQRCRTGRAALLALAAALVFPLLGAALYALVRPCERDADRRARALWLRTLEELLAEPEQEHCLVCRTPLEPEFVRCPSCATPLTHECDDCGRTIRFGWSACPVCVSGRARPPL